MHTEEQAKAKTCPHLNAPCLASGCMAWRPDYIREERKVRLSANGRYPKGYKRVDERLGCASLDGKPFFYEYTAADGDGTFDLISRRIGEGGYCGLAGQPS